MGKLYQYCEQIQAHIENNRLDVFRTRGQLNLRCGFLISLVTPDEPDDPQRLTALKDAARDVLGLELR